MTRELNDRQRLFCNEYIIDLNASQAAIRAGYSVKTAQRMGSENLHKHVIKQEIARLIKKRSDKTEITSEKVIHGIVEVIEDAKTMRYTETGDAMTNHAAALKGYELLGKHLAMWTDKKVVDATMKVTGIQVVGCSNKDT